MINPHSLSFRRRFFGGIICLGFAAASFAEPFGQQRAGAIIVGTVIDSVSGDPIQGVRVTRIELAGTGRQFETLSDDRGRFAFTGVEAGRWRIVGELSGYESGANDRRRRNGPDRPVVVNAGSHETVVIRMFPSFGSLCGVAVDDVNQPAAGISVNAAVFVSASTGSRSYAMSSGAATDEAGRFCIKLIPGRYSVVIPPVTVVTLRDQAAKTAQPGVPVQQRVQRPSIPQLKIDDFDVFLGNQLRVGSLPPTTSSARLDSVYELSFHPPDEASMHTVMGGQTTVIGDVSLRRAMAHMVAGRVIGPSGAVPQADVRVIPLAFAHAIEGTLDIAATTTENDGSFTMFGIPAGQFVIRATAAGSGGTLWAERQLSVGNSDPRGISVELRPGVRANGRVVLKSSNEITGDLLPRVSVSLVPVETQIRGAAPTRPMADGTFQTGDYPPGRYLLSATAPTGWVVESAIYRKQDIALVPVTLSSDESIDVVVTLTDRPATLVGHVRTSTGAADSGATVLLFPVQYHFRSSSGSPVPLFREARVAPNGSYEFRGVVPAEYFVLAIDDAAAEGWRRAETVPRLAAAAERIRLAVGDQLTKELRTQTIGSRR